jgi:hypothetical protein
MGVVVVVVGAAVLAAVAWLVINRPLDTLWPLRPPFPADYVAISGPTAASVHFESDGTVNALNLPVWNDTKCVDPERVSGAGRWYQDPSTGQLWIDVSGKLVAWGPDVWWGDYVWEKVIMPHCAVYGVDTQTLFAPSD